MKVKILVCGATLLLAGCSSAPVYKLSGYSGPEAMHRNEVVQAARECIRARLRPNVEYTSQKVKSGGRVLVPVNVHCEPY
jgi:starvation-inducible outer membrane lipoprotein